MEEECGVNGFILNYLFIFKLKYGWFFLGREKLQCVCMLVGMRLKS